MACIAGLAPWLCTIISINLPFDVYFRVFLFLSVFCGIAAGAALRFWSIAGTLLSVVAGYFALLCLGYTHGEGGMVVILAAGMLLYFAAGLLPGIIAGFVWLHYKAK